jgi:hypothetical protein
MIRFPRRLAQRLACEHALGIVAANETMGGGERRVERRHQFIDKLRNDIVSGFLVSAEHLLARREEPRLDRGLTFRIAHPRSGDARGLAGDLGDGFAGGIEADDAEETSVAAEARDIARDIAGAADTQLLLTDLENRRRSFRRNPNDVAEQVAIEHRVAEDDDLRVGERDNPVEKRGHFTVPSSDQHLARSRATRRSPKDRSGFSADEGRLACVRTMRQVVAHVRRRGSDP